MKLTYKGKFYKVEQLKKGALPEHAVMFKEPKTGLTLNLVVLAIAVPLSLLISLFVLLKQGSDYSFSDMFSIGGVMMALITILPHEYLHAIGFSKDAEVDLWIAPKMGAAFVHSVKPVSKLRFIYLSILPNLVFGIIPFIIWFSLPMPSMTISKVLFTWSALNLLMGCGDFMNIYNAATQMPKNALTQLHGFNSYWYIPQEVCVIMDSGCE